jgi:hypothetical protein
MGVVQPSVSDELALAIPSNMMAYMELALAIHETQGFILVQDMVAH